MGTVLGLRHLTAEDGLEEEILTVATIAPQKQPRNRGDRSNSPRRWQEAYVRALEEDLRAFTMDKSVYTWFVTSGSMTQTGYRVDVFDLEKPRCSCTAATKGEDPVCKHRALVLARLGFLPKLRREQEETAAIAGVALTAIDIP